MYKKIISTLVIGTLLAGTLTGWRAAGMRNLEKAARCMNPCGRRILEQRTVTWHDWYIQKNMGVFR